MKNFSLKIGTLLVGYVALSETAGRVLPFAVAESLAAFAMLVGIYWLPPRLKVNFINWAGGSALVAVCLFVIDLTVLNSVSVVLLSAFFLSRIK